jgi:hypothetical protein
MLQTNTRDPLGPSPAAHSLASWYAPGVSDGLGDRLLMFDNSAGPSLELLRFRPELAERPEFEGALREQVQRLSRFQHPAFARVRSVQRLEPDGDLALVSNHTPGKRLSEILHRAHGPAFAAALIRQLTPALADLQQQHPGAAHGLLSPERIVVSPDARLTIVEHVIGPAMASAGLHPGTFGSSIALAPANSDGPALTPSADWYQLGLVTLSVVLGRPLTADDLPQVETLVAQAIDAAARDGAAVSPLVAQWLEQSLRISGEGISSGPEARALLGELTGERATSAATKALPRRTEAAPAPKTPSMVTAPERPTAPAQVIDVAPVSVVSPPVAPAPRAEAAQPSPRRENPVERPDAALADFPAEPQRTPEPAVAPPPSSPRPVMAQPPLRTVAASSVQELSPFEREVLAGRLVDTTSERARAVSVQPSPWTSRRVAAVAGIALVVGAASAWFAGAGWSSPPAIGLQTLTTGEHVLTQNGVPTSGPIALSVGPELSWVRTTSAAALAVPGSKPESGIMRISSPMPLKVVEGGRALGSIPGSDLKLSPGKHEIELVNETVGYRLLHAVEITGGENVLLQIAPRPGSITVEAAVGTEVSIDGRAMGRTPIAAVTLVPGEYQVAFRSARGTTDRQRVVVKPDGTTHVVAKGR